MPCCCVRPCCEFKLPNTLHVTFTNVSGCACFDGQTVAVTNVGGGEWRGNPSGGICGNLFQVSVFCNQTQPGWGVWSISIICGDIGGGNKVGADANSSCANPIQIVFSNIPQVLDSGGIGCCSGTVTATVTV